MARRESFLPEIEWTAGIASLPGYVTEDEQLYRPDILIWLDDAGLIVGNAMSRPGEMLEHAARSLEEAIRKPAVGKPRKPTRIRTESPALAETLRACFPQITFTVAPTPEIDEAVSAMQALFREPGEHDVPPSYLSGDVDAGDTASFFAATANLYRAKPWQSVESDTDIFLVTIPGLEVHDAALSVIGQAGQSFGFLIFPGGITAFDHYMDAAQDFMPGGPPPRLPMHISLNFERGADLEDSLRKEIVAHDWEVAGPAAYPWVMVLDEDLVTRPPTRRELATLEAIARALPTVLEQHADALLAGWDSGEPVSSAAQVSTVAGLLDVTFVTATELDLPEGEVIALLEELHETWLAEIDGEAGPEEREELVEDFIDQFRSSNEAAGIRKLRWSRLLMELAMFQHEISLLDIDALLLREILFATLPRKVLVPASDAPAIVAELRALFEFLANNTDLASARGCLRVLGPSAVGKLAAALGGDSSNTRRKGAKTAGSATASAAEKRTRTRKSKAGS